MKIVFVCTGNASSATLRIAMLKPDYYNLVIKEIPFALNSDELERLLTQ